VVAIVCWYIGVQSTWFARKLGGSLIAGFLDTLIASSISIVLFMAVALIIW
jgi:hypothetical protein